MADDANSWIRRTKFSHTVCHRLDSSRLVPIQFTILPDRISGLKSRPATTPDPPCLPKKESASEKSVPNNSKVQRNPIINKQRSLSPLPETSLSDAFKEARSERKRSMTPVPRRRDPEKGIVGKFVNSRSPSNSSPLRHLASLKFNEKSKTRKDSSWAKYFDHGGGRIIRVPDDDETGALAARLEKQFVREVTLLSRLHHQNVIKFVAACRKPPVYCVITEYLSEGSLRAYLHKLERKSLPLQKLIAIALDIARGMEYIHSQDVIHRDLKPENVLIDQDFHMKIADFGIACEEAYCDSLADDPGTYRWMAPEMIKHKSYGRRVDVYSFGLILWEMVAGTIPYEDMNPIQAAFAVVNKNLRPAIPENCPPAMRALIEQCWSLHPDKRPEFWQIVKVLEQFESSLARDGTLNLVQNPTCQDHKKGLLHWIQKLGPVHPTSSSMPKPKFT
ncbi:hypothetical protein SLA2020_369500 [Shorea laevis]